MIYNIQRWSLHDGPGIRTTIFFKGCPLRCRWCSNPESWSFEKQIVFIKDQCSSCGVCIDVCPADANIMNGQYIAYDRAKCIICGRCVETCPKNARELFGQDLSVDEMVQIIERDAVFYRSSGGGVTFSGGEPFVQMDVLKKLAKGCVFAGIRTAIETCGFFSLKDAEDIFDWIDDIIIDLKHTNDQIHKKLTGVSNNTIIENIIRLDEMGRELTIRIPLIKNITSDPKNIDGVIRLCKRLKHLIGIELLPYHSLGVEKYNNLNIPYDSTLAAPDREDINLILELMHSHKLKAKSLGMALCQQ